MDEILRVKDILLVLISTLRNGAFPLIRASLHPIYMSIIFPHLLLLRCRKTSTRRKTHAQLSAACHVYLLLAQDNYRSPE